VLLGLLRAVAWPEQEWEWNKITERQQEQNTFNKTRSLVPRLSEKIKLGFGLVGEKERGTNAVAQNAPTAPLNLRLNGEPTIYWDNASFLS